MSGKNLSYSLIDSNIAQKDKTKVTYESLIEKVNEQSSNIPDYLYDGKGMRIDGVSQGRPAEKAGFQKGDIVIKLGDEDITDMMSYMKALSKYKKGDKAEVQISRKNKLSIKKVTF